MKQTTAILTMQICKHSNNAKCSNHIDIVAGIITELAFASFQKSVLVSNYIEVEYDIVLFYFEKLPAT